MLSLLLVSKQLRITIVQIRRYSTVEADDKATRWKNLKFQAHRCIDVLVGLFVVFDVTNALLDGFFIPPLGIDPVIFMLQVIN